MSKICFGCGAKFQTEDPTKDGFVPVNKLEDSKYCQRCFRMIHYGEISKSSEPKTIESIIKSVNKNAKFVVFIVDFINIFDEVIKIFNKIRVPKILVISKSDIIPKNISFSQIKNYLKIVYNIKCEIVFTSYKSNLNTFIKNLYNKDEIYFLGLTNSGKSTLLNSLAKKFDSNGASLTTSYKENTTQDFIRIRIGDWTMIDSPGFVIENFELDKYTNIAEEIKPITYQNKIECTYKLGSLFDIFFKDSVGIVFYFSKNIKISRLYNKKVEGTTFTVKGNSDIVICGLGFIKVLDDTLITVQQDMMKYINIRPSIVGGVYE